MSQGWICPVCGEIAEGELCVHCGKTRGPLVPGGPAPGSYLSLIGYRSGLSWKPASAVLLFLASVAMAGAGRPLLLILDVFLLIAFLPSAVLTIRLLCVRIRRHKG